MDLAICTGLSLIKYLPLIKCFDHNKHHANVHLLCMRTCTQRCANSWYHPSAAMITEFPYSSLTLRKSASIPKFSFKMGVSFSLPCLQCTSKPLRPVCMRVVPMKSALTSTRASQRTPGGSAGQKTVRSTTCCQKLRSWNGPTQLPISRFTAG